MKEGGDRDRWMLDARLGSCGSPPTAFRLRCGSAKNGTVVLAQKDPRFRLFLDEPDGVAGRFEPPPACVAGGCQW